jgi:3-oxoacyl-[acyl-carrier-protein] synthase-3
MRWHTHDVYVAATGTCLPGEVTVADAIASGRYTQAEAERSGQLAATVALDGQGAPDLAVAAARQALERAGYEPSDVAVLLHAVLFHAGLDVWNSTAYIHRELGISDARTFISEVRNGCNGLGSVDLAARWLVAEGERRIAVITAADCFPDPFIDRWGSPGIVFGDGGTAIVVTRDRRRAFARILSTYTITESALEPLHRGDDPFGPGQFPIDLSRRFKAFRDRTGPKESGRVMGRREKGMIDVVQGAVADAGLTLADIDHFAYSFISRRQLAKELLEPLDLDIGRTTWEYGRRTGHMGNSDTFAGLNYLAESGRLAERQKILLIGAGGGYAWTAAVLDVIDCPSWAVGSRAGKA